MRGANGVVMFNSFPCCRRAERKARHDEIKKKYGEWSCAVLSGCTTAAEVHVAGSDCLGVKPVGTGTAV